MVTSTLLNIRPTRMASSPMLQLIN
uniref:Uncharacterized protein n=1 Tax=Stomoxys calcitrans TaxID=35570 RepID=A0A1I8PWB8_STOCA